MQDFRHEMQKAGPPGGRVCLDPVCAVSWALRGAAPRDISYAMLLRRGGCPHPPVFLRSAGSSRPTHSTLAGHGPMGASGPTRDISHAVLLRRGALWPPYGVIGGGAPGTQVQPSNAVAFGRGGARERREGCPHLVIPNGAYFAATRWAGRVFKTLQQHDPRYRTDVQTVLVPQGRLHLADVGLASHLTKVK